MPDAAEDARIPNCYQIQEGKLQRIILGMAITNTDKKPESLQGFKQTMKEPFLPLTCISKTMGISDYYIGIGLSDLF